MIGEAPRHIIFRLRKHISRFSRAHTATYVAFAPGLYPRTFLDADIEIRNCFLARPKRRRARAVSRYEAESHYGTVENQGAGAQEA